MAESDIDKIIKQLFYNDKKNGVFLDIGAATPEFLSISKIFRESGWKVISVEPNPFFANIHKELGYEIHEYACGPTNMDDVDFYIYKSDSQYNGGNVTYESFSSLGLNSFLHQMVSLLKLEPTKIKVKLRKLDWILKNYYPELKKIDILSIDVEGWEADVLSGFTIEKYNPNVVILENFTENKFLRNYMVGKNYKFFKYIAPNDVFIKNIEANYENLTLSSPFIQR